MSFVQFLRKNFKPKTEALRDDIKARNDPDFFPATGTQVFCGRQGSGKTISAVHTVRNIKKLYPKSILVSNVKLSEMEALRFHGNKNELKMLLHNMDKETQYIYFSSFEELEIVLVSINNGFLGVIYLIDEIHTYFNSLDSKNVGMHVFTEISQQRKQRKLMIGTSQLFTRMAKPFREQCDNIVICSTIFGFITFQNAYDGMTLEQAYDGSISGDIKKRAWFFHDRALRNSFDTYQKVVSGELQLEQFTRTVEPKKSLLHRKVG